MHEQDHTYDLLNGSIWPIAAGRHYVVCVFQYTKFFDIDLCQYTLTAMPSAPNTKTQFKKLYLKTGA